MAKRRTSQIQRRPRATDEALNRRLAAGSALNWRVLLIIGAAIFALAIVGVVVLVNNNNNQYVGQIQPDGGRSHIEVGQVPNYTSTPATSGPHWSQEGTAPTSWGVFTSPVPEPAVLHNLEHGGIVIWYQPEKVSDADVKTLADYVRARNATERYKFILTPWSGKDFGHPIAVTAWRWLLYLDSANTDALRGFADAHYGKAPEPNGGPGPP